MSLNNPMVYKVKEGKNAITVGDAMEFLSNFDKNAPLIIPSESEGAEEGDAYLLYSFKEGLCKPNYGMVTMIEPFEEGQELTAEDSDEYEQQVEEINKEVEDKINKGELKKCVILEWSTGYEG